MKGKPPVKIPDIFIILVSVFVTLFSFLSMYAHSGNNTQVLIEGKNQKWIYPLDTTETVNVRGPLGITVIRVNGNEAWVESSPCYNQICVTAGHLSRNGQFAACLPNNVLLAIEGYDDGEIDGFAW